MLLWGFTAILGRLIEMDALQIVAWRMLLVVALLALLPRVWRAVKSVPRRLLGIYAGIGLLVAAHWLAFYGSVKLANASVAAATLGIAPAVTALLEPWVTGNRFRRREFLLGVVMAPGLWLIFGGVPPQMGAGFWVGIVSAVLAAAFIALNKRFIGAHDALGITAIEIAAGGLVVLLIASLATSGLQRPSLGDLGWLLVLATACTIVPFALSLVALRELSAFTAQLAVNLEPLYTIAIAAIWLGEARELDGAFYAGALLLVAGVLAHACWGTRAKVPAPEARLEPQRAQQ